MLFLHIILTGNYKIIELKKYFTCLLFIISSCNSEKKEDDSSVMLPGREREMRSAINKYPDSLLLRENLIQYYRDNADYDKALEETNNAINRDSTDPRFYDIQGILHFENGDTLRSIHSFEKAISLYPAPEYLISLGTLYAQTKNEKAIFLADALLKQDRLKAGKETFFIKGLYYSYTNQKEKAITFFDKILQMDFTFMDAYREKAIALYDLGRYNDALTVIDKAVTLQNNFDEGYYYKGKILEKLNRFDEAIASYQRALLYDPGYTEAKVALGRLGIK